MPNKSTTSNFSSIFNYQFVQQPWKTVILLGRRLFYLRSAGVTAYESWIKSNFKNVKINFDKNCVCMVYASKYAMFTTIYASVYGLHDKCWLFRYIKCRKYCLWLIMIINLLVKIAKFNSQSWLNLRWCFVEDHSPLHCQHWVFHFHKFPMFREYF